MSRGGILLGALFSAGVLSQALAADKVVIGYSAPALLGGQGQIQAGLVNGAKAKGWEVITITSGGDAQKQLNDINDLIAQQVKAIVAVPDDSAGICQAVAVAKEANIPFYTIDRAPSGCQVDMVVLSDNYLAGKQAGEAMVEFLKARHGSPKGKVLEVTGNLAQNVAQLRGAGFNDVMKQYPDVTSSPRSATGMPARASISFVTSSPPKPISTASTCIRTASIPPERSRRSRNLARMPCRARMATSSSPASMPVSPRSN